MTPYITDILTTLRLRLKPLPLWKPSRFQEWCDEVSFWLARIVDEEEYQRWITILAYDLHAKLPERSPKDCLHFLESKVLRALHDRKAGAKC